jgi:hypothetical protein
MSQLTTTQEQVLTLLAQGSTVAAAAQVDLALYWHEQLLAFGDRAIQTLDRIFSDENESSGVQLRAAMEVLEKLMKPGPVQPELANPPPSASATASRKPAVHDKRTRSNSEPERKRRSSGRNPATPPRPHKTAQHRARTRAQRPLPLRQRT